MTRHDWAHIAKGWETNADAFRRQTMPVASWMIDHTAPQVGRIARPRPAKTGDIWTHVGRRGETTDVEAASNAAVDRWRSLL